MLIDIHTHSTCSDGTATPTEVVQQAAAAGLEVLALTDHDTSAGWDEAMTAADLGAGLLVVSQFTLYGDTRKGRRPTWNAAAPGPMAEPLVRHLVAALQARGARVETGVFGAAMEVELVNDGPFTVLLEV